MQDVDALITKLIYYLAGVHRRSVYNVVDTLLMKPEVLENSTRHGRLLIGKTYSLAEDGNLAEAEQYLAKLDLRAVPALASKHEIEGVMLRAALKYLNRIDTMLAVPGSSSEELYEAHFLLKAYGECKKHSAKLIKEKPALAMMAVIADHSSTFKASAQMLLDRVPVTSTLLLVLYQHGFPFMDMTGYLKKINCRDFSFFLLMKHLLLRGEDLSALLAAPVTDILEVLDDWEVYAYAMASQLPVLERPKSLNYLRYQMMVCPTPANIARFAQTEPALKLSLGQIKQLPSDQLAELLSLLSQTHRARVGYFLCHRRLGLGDIKLFSETVEDFLFLASQLLLAKDESGPISVLILCYSYRKRYRASFQVQILLAVMYRYFLMYQSVCKEYTRLDIHTIQLDRLSYLWSDLHLLLGHDSSLLLTEYRHTHRAMLSQINGNLMEFIERGEYAQVLSLIKLRDTLLSSPTHQQLTSQTIVPDPTPSCLAELLLPEAGYVFDKLTSHRLPVRDTTAATIHALPVACSEANLTRLFNDALDNLDRAVSINRSSLVKLYHQFINAQTQAYAKLTPTNCHPAAFTP